MQFRTLLATLSLGTLLSACADPGASVSPTAATVSDVLLAKSGTSPSGGGGTSGGGGGGTSTPVAGQIRTASAGAACDAGTSMGVTIRKGIQDRSEIVMSITGPLPGPSAAPGNSLYWSFTIVDDATGARLLGYGTSSQFAGVSSLITISGASTTPGVHTFRFLAQNHEIPGLLDFTALLAAPAVETCTATLVVTAR